MLYMLTCILLYLYAVYTLVKIYVIVYIYILIVSKLINHIQQ